MNPIMFEGVQGIQMGLKGMKQSAQDMAELNLDDKAAQPVASEENVSRADTSGNRLEDTAQAVTDLMIHKRQIQASAKVLEASDEMLGYLIDIRA